MHRSVKWSFALLLGMICSFLPVSAQTRCSLPGPAVQGESVRVTVVDSVRHRLRVTYSARARGAGKLRVTFRPASSGEEAPGDTRTVLVDCGAVVTFEWEAPWETSDYQRIGDVSLELWERRVDRAGSPARQAHSIYAEVVKASVLHAGLDLDPARLSRWSELPPMGPAKEREAHLLNVPPVDTSWKFHVHVRGRVSYQDFYGDSIRGVPGLSVQLYWYDSLQPSAEVRPPHCPGETHVTDIDGYYSFDYEFRENQPTGQWGDEVRIKVGTVNDAAFSGDLGYAVTFPTRGKVPIHDMIDRNSWIDSNGVDIIYDANHGPALRYLYRAMQFAKTRLRFTPNQIRYYFKINDPDITVSYFHGPGSDGHGYDIGVPRIVFNLTPFSEVVYHEYGHFLEFNYERGIPYSGYHDQHWFTKETSAGLAWNEGWAEFICALTHDYWYAIEQPEHAELFNTYSEGHSPLYQFLDYSQSAFHLDRDRSKVEGVAACFLYSLFDDTPNRGPGYTGDNEDLGYDNGTLFRLIQNRYLSNGALRGSTQLEAYRDAVLNALSLTPSYAITYLYHRWSINMVHDYLMGIGGPETPATATNLRIGTNAAKRPVLVWDNNTEPSSIDRGQDGNSNVYTFNLQENQESGFVIYRKEIPSGWYWDGRDGRLDPAYRMIAVVGTNVTTYTDPGPFQRDKRYSYVVVAYNRGDASNPSGLAIPKAEAEFVAERNITIRSDHPDRCDAGAFLTPAEPLHLHVDTQIEIGSVHWLLDHQPAFILASGQSTGSLGLLNTYQDGMPVPVGQRFSIRCVVTDVDGVSDTSDAWYPQYAPLDSTSAIVQVLSAGAFVPDRTVRAGVEMLAFPGQKMPAVYPLRVRPTLSDGRYVVRLVGLPSGMMDLDAVKLYAVDHPVGGRLDGTARCGFGIYHHSSVNGDDSLDTTRAYERRPLPLAAAVHTAIGPVTSLLAELDGSSIPVSGTDSLVLQFEDTVGITNPDTLAHGDVDFLIEIVGGFIDTPPSSPMAEPVAAVPGGIAEEATDSIWMERASFGSGRRVIGYRLTRPGYVRLVLYDPTGRMVRVLEEGSLSSGSHAAILDDAELPSGGYLCTLETSRSGRRSIRVPILH